MNQLRDIYKTGKQRSFWARYRPGLWRNVLEATRKEILTGCYENRGLSRVDMIDEVQDEVAIALESSGEYGSIILTLVLPILIKLAVTLLIDWLFSEGSYTSMEQMQWK